ncbi:MAG: acetylglutamate kinase [Candidatus Eisenbacteria bacterium]|nr:acetylglutamate kinase [Candidatus Eisenbacteria bacterium]
MTHTQHGGNPISGLRQALPYLRLYRGRTFVVKLGGEACLDPRAVRSLLEQVGVLSELAIRIVLVHGGGPQTSRLAERLGLTTTKLDGRRVTDAATLETVVLSINGEVNTSLLSAARAVGLAAVGLSGIDAGLVRARRRPVVDGRDYGLVGDIEAVDPRALRLLLADGLVPIVSPIAADDDGAPLNVNADTVAAAIARALGAEKLLFLLDRPGILEHPDDPGSLVSYLDLAGLARMIESGAIAGGMLPKARAAADALAGEVGRVHFLSAFERDALLREVFTNDGAGTLLVREKSELAPAERLDDLPSLSVGPAGLPA